MTGNRTARAVASVPVMTLLFAGCVLVMTCVPGASIGFVSHKTAGHAGELPDTAAGRRWQNDPDTPRREPHGTEQRRTPETARRREVQLPREGLFRPDELYQTDTPQQADGAAAFRNRVRAGR